MGAAEGGLDSSAKVLDGRRMEITGDGAFALLGIRCLSCGARSHPARRHCPSCGGPAEVTQLSTAGEVIVATVAHTARAELLIQPPYQVVLVRLSDGPVLKLPSLASRPLRAGDAITVEPLVLAGAAGPVVAMQACPVGSFRE
jgi:rubredoxin-like zinc ribbon protein